MQRDIHVKWFLPHSPEDVWACLTDSDLIDKWLMKNDFKPVAGHRFQFQGRPMPAVGWDGIVYCEVLEIVPLKKLSFNWKGGPGKGAITLDSVVTWTLIPRDKGTELILEHKGFAGFKNCLSSLIMEKGWAGRIRRRFEQVINEFANANIQP